MGYQHENWKGNTGGTPWMQRTLIRWFRHTPLCIPYFCMGWMIPFYMLFNHAGYLASYHYFRRRHHHGVLRSFCDSYLQHFRFGQIIIDRFAMFAGKEFRIEVEGQELFDELESAESGFVQLGSHIGNYELAGYSLRPQHKQFFALVFAGETETVMQQRQRMFQHGRVTMVPVSEDMSHIFTLSNALSEGNIVSMPGDRIFGSPRSLKCEILGAQAQLPLGPFSMAQQREVPLLALFVMKEKTQGYRILVRRLQADNTLSRKEQTAALAQNFADHISDVLQRYPHQWFNFYEFWN